VKALVASTIFVLMITAGTLALVGRLALGEPAASRPQTTNAASWQSPPPPPAATATALPASASLASLPTRSAPTPTAATLPLAAPSPSPQVSPIEERLEAWSAPAPLPSAASLQRDGCDPAYPEERTCIPPGPPFDQGCAITEERLFKVLPPDPQRLDHDGDGIGCEPIGSS
jgi:hypothetical protein